MVHVGQLALLRRLAGAPVLRAEDFFNAPISRDNVTLDRPRRRREPYDPHKGGEAMSVYVSLIGSPFPHDFTFTFTPPLSLAVECKSEKQLDALVDGLGKDGEAMIPPGDYGLSTKFARLADRFGVSWRPNLA
jgi:hypothetical protein